LGASTSLRPLSPSPPIPPPPTHTHLFQVITIICNLILLLYFGGEITDMRRSAPDDGYGEAKGLASNVDVQLSGSVGTLPPGPTFRSAQEPLPANPFAQSV
jgi:hypothetical protein